MADVMQVFRRELKLRQSAKISHETGEAEMDNETIEVLRALGYVR